jgi:hypothetical protein
MNDDKLIDAMGGTNAVACLCDVSPGAVSQWRYEGIPDARRLYLSEKFPGLVTYERKYQCAVQPAPTFQKVEA